jgi:small subunit ribosomal protein S1
MTSNQDTSPESRERKGDATEEPRTQSVDRETAQERTGPAPDTSDGSSAAAPSSDPKESVGEQPPSKAPKPDRPIGPAEPEHDPVAEPAEDARTDAADVVMESAVRDRPEAATSESGAAADPVTTEPEQASEDMAQALAAHEAKAPKSTEPPLKPGRRMQVKLVQVGEKDSFVDYGGRSEGSIATAELRGEKGELRVQQGESFQAIVKKVGDTVEFTVGRARGGPDLLRLKELQDAYENSVPVNGTVKATNKGGFEINLRGMRGFCPFSQIDTIYCDRPEDFVGQALSFQIIAFERGGKNIVLSRRRLLEAEAKEAATKTRELLEVGASFEGIVRRLQPYGAFVDIGGIDGLVHVSEMSRSHVRDPKELLKVGEKVKVQVIGIDQAGTPKERISLSMKIFEEDPWSDIEEKLKVGATVPGKVVRLTDFGAFVELAPGVDGLVHISEISHERIQHPGDVLQKEQEVQVRVLNVDMGSRRISLSLRDPSEAQERPAGRRPQGRRSSKTHATDAAEPSGSASSAKEGEEPSVDVTKLEYDEALQLLKEKFGQD